MFHKIEIKEEFDFSKRFSPKRKKDFAKILMDIQSTMPIKASSRGWGYLLEQNGYITKDQFDRVQDAVNDLRRQGIIPVDFVAEDEKRIFSGVDQPYSYTMQNYLKWQISGVLDNYEYYQGNYWAKEDYYIQCIVEKVDVRNLFQAACEEYHIPIANASGWSSISCRAEFARRFKEAEEDGKTCVLLYCGDHDPDGLRISDTLRKNLDDIKQITWADGYGGYDPKELIIDRFGLQYEFIISNGFTWIDNLVTGGKTKAGKSMNLADPGHPNHSLPYVQAYLKKVGARKCEANVLITNHVAADRLIRDAIAKYLDPTETKKHYAEVEEDIQERYDEALDTMKVDVTDIKDEDNMVAVRAFIEACNEQH